MKNSIKKKKGRKIMKIILGVFAVFVVGIVIYFNIPYSPYKSAFTKKMKSRAQMVNPCSEVCTSEEFAKLPEPLQRYCNYIGLENTPKYQVIQTDFYKTKFVMDDKKNEKINMDYDLWLFYDKPFRSAFCTSSVKGIPFDGMDYCTDDKKGGMKGFLGKAIQIFDVNSEQGYQAGLISWVAETAAINPSGLLSPYISYEVLDDKHVKATIQYDGVSGSGIFTINDEGAITEFYSDERQMEEINGVQTRIGWRCEYENYQQVGTMYLAQTVRSIKVYPDKEIVYFDSDNFKVNYIK